MFRDSAYYKYLGENPPPTVEYVNKEKKGARFFGKGLKAYLGVKLAIHFIRKFFPIPNIVIENEGADLVHCGRCINIGKLPYVVDIEDFWSLGGVKAYLPFGRMFIARQLASPKCKAILPWTKHAKENFLRIFDKRQIVEKTEVVYPAVPLQKYEKKEEAIIYIARYFWVKGGMLALEVMERIKAKYDVKCYVVADVPSKLKRKYNLEFLGTMPFERLKPYFSKSKLLLYPTLSDTFGFATIEAMSFGCPPIVTKTEDNYMEEIVERRYGRVVDARGLKPIATVARDKRFFEVVEKLVEEVAALLEDGKEWKKLSEECRKEIKEGKFSIKERNKRLEEAYYKGFKK